MREVFGCARMYLGPAPDLPDAEIFGPKAQFKAERDVMEEVRSRLWKQVREGDGPKDMLDEGVMNGLGRTWKDPYKFLYDACKGMWAHHNKLDPNVV